MCAVCVSVCVCWCASVYITKSIYTYDYVAAAAPHFMHSSGFFFVLSSQNRMRTMHRIDATYTPHEVGKLKVGTLWIYEQKRDTIRNTHRAFVLYSSTLCRQAYPVNFKIKFSNLNSYWRYIVNGRFLVY